MLRRICAIYGSFSAAWASEPGARVRLSAFVVGGAFALAAAELMLAQRTHFMQEAAPHRALPWMLSAMLPLILLSPCRSEGGRRAAVRWLPIVAALLPFIPQWAQIGVGLAALGGLLAWLPGVRPQRWSHAALMLAAGWAAACVSAIITSHIDARIGAIPGAGPLLAEALGLMGYTASSDGHLVHLTSHGSTVPVLSSFDKWGGTFLPAFIATVAVLGLITRTGWRALGAALAVTALYALGRTAWTVAAFAENRFETLRWWHEEFILVSYAPLLVMVPIVMHRFVSAQKHSEARTRGGWMPPFAAGVGTLALCLGSLWFDGGTLKSGRVVFDEYYSDWEWTDDPIDTKRFGVKTVYSYYNFAEALGHYFDVGRNYEEITDEMLSGVSVLILKTPTKPYSEQAKQAIYRFVENGGGLWLIGDHTNVFGVGDRLNELADERFGMVQNPDAVIDPDANRQLFRPSSVAHPIARRMGQFLWMTGNSVRAPWWSRDAVLSRRLLCDNPDFSANTGFGDFRAELDERVGAVTQVVGLRVGKGRVAAWTDSTVFSNFSIFIPGKMEVALGFVDWLNRSNRPVDPAPVLFAVGALLIGVSFVRPGFGPRTGTAWAGAACACALIPAINDRQFPAPNERRPFERIAFLEPSPTSSHLPLVMTFNEPAPDGYLTAFVAAQRAGKRPFVATSLEQIKDSEAVVIIHNAHRAWTADEISVLLSYVERGGRLILLDAGGGDASLLKGIAATTSLDVAPYSYKPPEEIVGLLGRLRSQVGRGEAPSIIPPGPVLTDQGGRTLGPRAVRSVVSGCEPIITFGDPAQTSVGTLRHGRGTIVVSTTTSLFGDQSLGDNSAVPDAVQYALQSLLFEWYGFAGAPKE